MSESYPNNEMTDEALTQELESVVAGELERHLGVAHEWSPYEEVPWERGKSLRPGYIWDPDEYPLSDAARNVLIMNLLTEDNLPYYTESLLRIISRDGAWAEWIKRWTAEEGRHSIVIRDYLTVTRAVDPRVLESLRIDQLSIGRTPQPPGVAEVLAYVTYQEEATRLVHSNTAKLLSDKDGKRIMGRVAGDEALHALFYFNLTAEALKIDPSRMVTALYKQLQNFAMPSAGNPSFEASQSDYVKTGVFDLAMLAKQVFEKIIQELGIEDLEGLSSSAERARTRIFTRIDRLKKFGELALSSS